MSEERLIDTWGRLEVEWRDALEHAIARQREYDGRMTNHLVYHLAPPENTEREEIAKLWNVVREKRQAADNFLEQHANPALRS